MLQDFIERDCEWNGLTETADLSVLAEDNCEMLHGGVKDEDRMAVVDRFQRPDSDVFVFLISKFSRSYAKVYAIKHCTGTLAGGVGLNLTAVSVFKLPRVESLKSSPSGQQGCYFRSQLEYVHVPALWLLGVSLITLATIDPAHDLQAMDRYVRPARAIAVIDLN